MNVVFGLFRSLFALPIVLPETVSVPPTNETVDSADRATAAQWQLLKHIERFILFAFIVAAVLILAATVAEYVGILVPSESSLLVKRRDNFSLVVTLTLISIILYNTSQRYESAATLIGAVLAILPGSAYRVPLMVVWCCLYVLLFLQQAMKRSVTTDLEFLIVANDRVYDDVQRWMREDTAIEGYMRQLVANGRSLRQFEYDQFYLWRVEQIRRGWAEGRAQSAAAIKQKIFASAAVPLSNGVDTLKD